MAIILRLVWGEFFAGKVREEPGVAGYKKSSSCGEGIFSK
jgi:hypothetical protein